MEHDCLKLHRKIYNKFSGRAGGHGETAETGSAPFLPAGRRRILRIACLAAGFSLVASNAMATTVSNGDTLSSFPGDGIWNLAGNATVDTPISLGGDLNINGVDLPGSSSTLTIGTASGSHAFSASSVTINTSGNIIFDGNNAANNVNNGSLIHSDGNIKLGTNDNTGNVTVTGMRTNPGGTLDQAHGGAIYSAGGNIEIGNDNGKVTLTGNTTNSVAGAVYTNEVGGGKITIKGTEITISGNSAGIHSGAIYTGEQDQDITIGSSGTSKVTIDDNSAGGSGGAIQASWGAVTVHGESIKLTNNKVTGWEGDTNGSGSGSGGAILGSRAVTIGDADSDVTITGNEAVGKGGAIYTSNRTLGDVIINGRSITLSGNTAGTANGAPSGGIAGPSYSSGYLGGGAIYANQNIELNGGAITMSGNKTAQGNGGALEAEGDITIKGSMMADNNQAPNSASYGSGGNTWRSGDGGALWAGHDVILTAGSGGITFSNNIAAGSGGAIRAGGNVKLNATDGDILFRGNTASDRGAAIWFQNSYNNVPSNATATFNAASGRKITFFDSIANNINYGLLTVNKIGSGTVIFDNNTSPIYGTTTVSEGAFVVRNGAVYGADVGTGAGDASFTVNSGATLAGGGTGEVRADHFTLNGTLDISGGSLKLSGHPAAGNASGGYSTFTLTTSPNTVTFGAGSQVLFNTYLNDASTQLTDKLVLNLGGGATSGQAAVIVKNTGGLGALTTGSGIELVETNNGTSAGAFALSGRVAAGAYEYHLFQGGSGADAGNQNWYLRSTINPDGVTPTVTPNVPTPNVPAPNVPSSTPDIIPPPTEITSYRTEVPVDSVIPALASRLGLGTVGTWHERRDGEYATNYTTPDGDKRAGWGRVFGQIGSYGEGFTGSPADRVNAFNDHGSSYDFRYGGIQAGIDLRRKENEKENDKASRDIPGLYLAAGTARADVDALVDYGFGTEAGRVTMDGYSLGAYWTHIGKSGWYIDPVLQGTYYASIEATSKINESQTLKTDGYGLLASLEGGYPIALKHDFTFEPQAQIVYQYLNVSDDADAFGRIDFSDDGSSLYGRLAGRLSKDWTREDGRKTNAWGRVGLWTDFGAQAETKFSNLEGRNSTTVKTDLGGSWAQFDLGVSRQLRDNVSLFVVGDYNISVTDVDGQSWGGRAGLTIEW